MDHYQYSDLDTETPSFRLLNLRKGDGSQIECDVFHASISDPDTVSYEAVSYVWGTNGLVDYINVDGQRLWITENLYIALQCLRSQDQDRILWVDAICINQFNLTERSQQVLEMGRIFGHATRVVFWLGKPTVEAVLLMDTLSKLEAKVAAFPRKYTTADKTVWKSLWSSVQPTHESQNNDLLTQQQNGLISLLERPWFERIWILQEVYFAQSAIVCSGKLSVSANIFALSPHLLSLRPKLQAQSILDFMPRLIGVYPQPGEKRDSLFNLLSRFQASKATDQRDMIFALVGISSDPSHHELLRPDYAKSLPEVVHDVIRYWFESTAVTITEVMQFLARFGAVRVTYLVQSARTGVTTENIHVPSRLEVIKCVPDASLFLIEENDEGSESTQEQNTFHFELDKLQSTISRGEAKFPELCDPGDLRIVPWSNSQQRVTFVMVKTGENALSFAIVNGRKRLFDFLVDRIAENRTEALYRASIIGIRSGDLTAVELALGRGADIDKVGVYGTAIENALSYGRFEVVQLLINNGADVNMKSSHGTILQRVSQNGYKEMVQLLIDNGADVNMRCVRGTALEAASLRGNKELVQLLIDNGADVNMKGTHSTALEAASLHGHKEVVQLLINNGAEVNVRGFERVASNGYKEVIQLLIDNGVDVNMRGVRGTALEAASLRGNKELVQLLIDNGADVNMKGKLGTGLRQTHLTALGQASSRGRIGVVQLLIKHGADVNLEDAKGQTPLDLASGNGHREVAELLIKHGAKHEQRYRIRMRNLGQFLRK